MYICMQSGHSLGSLSFPVMRSPHTYIHDIFVHICTRPCVYLFDRVQYAMNMCVTYVSHTSFTHSCTAFEINI